MGRVMEQEWGNEVRLLCRFYRLRGKRSGGVWSRKGLNTTRRWRFSLLRRMYMDIPIRIRILLGAYNQDSLTFCLCFPIHPYLLLLLTTVMHFLGSGRVGVFFFLHYSYMQLYCTQVAFVLFILLSLQSHGFCLCSVSTLC